MSTFNVTRVNKLVLGFAISSLSAISSQAEVIGARDPDAGLCSILAHGVETVLSPSSSESDRRAVIGAIDGFVIPDGIPRVSIEELIKNGVTVTFGAGTPSAKSETVALVNQGGRIRHEAIDLLQRKLDDMAAQQVVTFGKKEEAKAAQPRALSEKDLFLKYRAQWLSGKDAIPYVLISDLLREANQDRRILNSSSTRITTDAGINSPKARPFVEKFTAVLALMEGYSQESHEGESKIRGIIHGLLGKFSIKPSGGRTKRVEANNWRTSAGQLLGIGQQNSSEIRPLSMDPMPNGLWRKPTKPIRNYGSGQFLYDGASTQSEDILDPKVVVSADLQIGKKFGGATPKVGVQIGGQKYKLKYLIPGISHEPSNFGELIQKLLGSSDEALTETPINLALAAAGFTIQPTYPKASVHIYIPGLKTQAEVTAKVKAISDEIAAGSKAAWSRNLDKVFGPQNIFVDASGRAYLKINNVSLEASSGDEAYIGAFDSETIQQTVQARAIPLIDGLWGNADQKDGNRSLMARTETVARAETVADGNSRRGQRRVTEVLYGLNDMGFGLGSWWWVKNAPNLYKWDFVDFDKTSENEIVTTFNAYFSSELFSAVTKKDAIWFTKRFAQITLAQWQQFFVSAQYPYPVAMFLAAKVKYRVAGLVDALGISGVVVQEDGQESYVALEGRKAVLKELGLTPENFRTAFTVKGYDDCFSNGRLIPCKAVPARFTLDSPWASLWNRAVRGQAFPTDSNGDVAPQIALLQDLPGVAVKTARDLGQKLWSLVRRR